MVYTAEQTRHMSEQLEDWMERESRLTTDLFALALPRAEPREMMQHGVSRRLFDLAHGARRVFEILPPEEEDPGPQAIADATAFLQAFVINTFGAMDNLAWLWSLQAHITAANGRPLPRSRIGLTPGHGDLRASLSDRTQACLTRADPWFDYLEEYRHALAHRILLYIPPRTLDDEDTAEFWRLGAQVGHEDLDWARWGEVLAAQRRLGVFQPVMMHACGEAARPVWFHGQMICDFATVIDVGEHILADLQALPPEVGG
ncbi:hypothetical protein [Brevundimonas sp. SORGH_AS_0993]|uniref:hypothetical protein n=1 Tax=Brevundimonas sp. SORGH_AS_0993 TaxID=3041794 RepID=UPI00278897B8|nr:hypothetical protein [Brevundimonas sp. SORGH_AS_0993]MDQ1155487.1 hypothetical protein [Brevundimonas sp. SORGH_AS_0993]